MNAERIGTIRTTETQIQRQTYEYAAWYRDYECPPQECDVFMTRNPEGRPAMIHYGLKGVCVDAHLASYFCGNRISNDDAAGQRAIGEAGTVTLSIYAYSLPANLTLAPEYEWLADQSMWDREVADRKLRSAIKYRTPRARLAREINLEWLLSNGSPELVEQLP